MIMFRNRSLLEIAFNLLINEYPTIEKAHYSLIGFKSVKEEERAINILNEYFKKWKIKTK